MPVQPCKHDVYKYDVTTRQEIVASDYVPPAMPIVAFPAFAHIDRGLDFESFTFAIVGFLADEVGITLVMVVLVRRALIHGIAENIGYQSGKIIPLYQFLQRQSDFHNHVLIHAVNDGLGQVRSFFYMRDG